jgi:hypothetical protein
VTIVGLLGNKRRVHLRHVQHRRIEDGMRAQQAFVRQRVAGVGCFHQQHKQRLLRFDTPHGAAGNHDVVARRQREMAIVAVKLTGTPMHEQQLVAIGIAHQMIHRGTGIPHPHANMRVTQDLRRLPRRRLILFKLVQIEGMRPQRPLELHPAGGRMAMMKERGRTEEAFLADLALERPLRQVGVRLP